MSSLLAGIGAGLSAAGGIGLQKQAEQKELERLGAIAKQKKTEAAEKRVQDLTDAGPKTTSFKSTGADGSIIETTNQRTYNPATDSFDTTELGKAISPPKDNRSSMERERDEWKENPEEYEKFIAARRGPGRGKGGSGGSAKRSQAEIADEILALSPEQRRAIAESKGRKPSPDAAHVARTVANADTKKAMSEFDGSGEKGRFALLSSMRIDPAAEDAREQYRAKFKADALGVEMGAVFENVTSGVKQKPASAGDSKDNPVDATTIKSEPPPGTWVRLPGGRVIQTP